MSLLDKLPAFVRGNKLVKITPLDVPYDSAGNKVEQVTTEAGIYDANIITSEYVGECHIPLIDIDMEVVAIDSTTPGHAHLYINKPMTFENLMKLLTVMEEVGIVQHGYVEGSKKRGYTALRLPHIKKGSEESGQVVSNTTDDLDW